MGLVGLTLLTHCGGAPEVEERTTGEPARGASTQTQGLSTTLTFGASADARVEADSPARNFGSSSSLGADLSPDVMESYLRFRLSGVTGTVTRAALRLYAFDGTPDGPRVFRSGGSWTEGGLTWNNRPAPLEGPLDDKGAISSGTWVEFDVTRAVRGDGEVNLAVIATSGNGTDFSSRESSRTQLRPRLVVTVEPTPQVPPECLPRLDTFLFGASPMEDGFVSRNEPDRSFGDEPELLVDGSPRLESYLEFSVTTEGLRVREARLELSAFDFTPDGPVLYRASNGWNEDLTWNTRPGLLEGPLGDLGEINAGTRVAYDVTGVVDADGTYSFGLLPGSGNGVDFYSREEPRSELRPRLSLTLETPLFCSYRGAGGGSTRWVRHYGGQGNERLHALATAPEGGFAAAGLFGGSPFPD
ncbi:MAG TPA: DNRLRE domain-containing protein [Archangium sp.]|uniref:CBM96 family carbohydrate-binding protein n=1 Tax=Archangium sp. TaxID=1872627 RepID=UPI002E326ED2|nr:DNRLRE domain-containing protein [Archangium sp.]HEX5747959.1 DNRLRE domain-containing protein [Archangium sp.]